MQSDITAKHLRTCINKYQFNANRNLTDTLWNSVCLFVIAFLVSRTQNSVFEKRNENKLYLVKIKFSMWRQGQFGYAFNLKRQHENCIELWESAFCKESKLQNTPLIWWEERTEMHSLNEKCKLGMHNRERRVWRLWSSLCTTL